MGRAVMPKNIHHLLPDDAKEVDFSGRRYQIILETMIFHTWTLFQSLRG